MQTQLQSWNTTTCVVSALLPPHLPSCCCAFASALLHPSQIIPITVMHLAASPFLRPASFFTALTQASATYLPRWDFFHLTTFIEWYISFENQILSPYKLWNINCGIDTHESHTNCVENLWAIQWKKLVTDIGEMLSCSEILCATKIKIIWIWK